MSREIKERFHILDGTRFFAALSVVLYHYLATGPGNTGVDPSQQFIPWVEFPELYPFFKFGFLGVNLFFFISGFVIFASAMNRTAIQFAILRWVRLFPTYWFAVLFTTVVTYLYNEEIFSISISQFLYNLTMLNSYVGVKNIDPVYWTLLVELHFYFCIFILLVFGLFKFYRTWLSLWVLFCVVYTVTSEPFFFSWLISPEYSSYFIAGIVFYIARQEGYDPWLIIILIAAYFLSIHDTFIRQVDLYTVNTTILDEIIGSVLVTLFYMFFYLISVGRLKVNANRVLVVLGGVTFPLYLIHLVAGRRLMDSFNGLMNEYLLVALTVSLMILLSYIIYILVDIKFCGILRKKLFLVFSMRRNS